MMMLLAPTHLRYTFDCSLAPVICTNARLDLICFMLACCALFLALSRLLSPRAARPAQAAQLSLLTQTRGRDELVHASYRP